MECYTFCPNLITVCPICRYFGTSCLICRKLDTCFPFFRYTGTFALIIFLNLPCNLCFYLCRSLCVAGVFCCTTIGEKRKPIKDSDPQIGKTNDNQVIKVQYVGCDAEAGIGGTKIRAIVQHFLCKMGLTEPTDTDAEDSYNKSCKALQENLHNCVPYHKTIKAEIIEKDKIISEMRDLLPQNRPIQFEPLIAEVSENVVAHFQHSAHKPSMHGSKVSSFVALKVSKSGENLELTPYCVVVSQEWSSETLMSDYTKREFQYYIQYKQEKFILSKFHIESICSKLTETNNDEANTPLDPQQTSNYDSISNDL